MHIESLPARRLLTVYLPDPTIGNQSFIYASPPDGGTFQMEVFEIDNDGKFVVAGQLIRENEQVDLAVVRFLADGQLDLTFAEDGWLVQSDGNAALNRAIAMSIAADGKYLIAGKNDDAEALNVLRLNANGTLDTGFADEGWFTLDVSGLTNFDDVAVVRSIAGGKTLLASSAIVNGGDPVLAMLQLNSSGTIDSSFGTSGILVTDLAAGSDLGEIVQIQSDGDIVIAGGTTETNSRSALRRYTSAGLVDSSFGTAGLAVVDLVIDANDRFNAIAIDANGDIIAAGELSGNDTLGIVRFTTAGVLDGSFSGDGFSLITPIPFQNVQGFYAESILIRDDGSLLLGMRQFYGTFVRDRTTLVLSDDGEIDGSIVYNGYLPNGSAREQGDKLVFILPDSLQRYGNDNVTLVDGTLSVIGTDENDLITVANSADGRINIYYRIVVGYLSLDAVDEVMIEAGAGADSVQSTNLAKPTTINAGDGYDELMVVGDSSAQVSLAGIPISLNGGDGPDELNLISNVPTLVTLVGGTGNDTIIGNHAARIYGNGGKDILFGGASRQYINGGGGNDCIDGGAGNDLIYGAGGQDTINGNAGRDRLFGDVGDDLLVGGSGDDSLDGGTGADTLTGRSGNDILYGADGVADILKGGDGIDDVLSLDELVDELLEVENS